MSTGTARLSLSLLNLLEPIFTDRRWYAAARGRALVDAGEPERAILYLHKRIARDSQAPWLHFHAGRAAQAKGLDRQARARFAHAAALVPDEPTFRFALGYALRHEGFPDAAAREYVLALEVVPGEPRILFNLGVVERERGNLVAAQACFEAVLLRWPKDVRTHYTLGVCAYECRDLPRAREAIDRALRLNRRHHKAWYQSALLHIEAKDPLLAREALHTTLKLQPSYAPAHFALGRSLLESDRPRARHHLREALLGHPPVLRAHLDLGRLYEQEGALTRARSEYLLYQRHFPTRRRVWLKTRIQACATR